jgi:hypothetical protein
MMPAIAESGELDGFNDAAIDGQFEPELRAVQERFEPLIAFLQAKAPGVGGKQVPAQQHS